MTVDFAVQAATAVAALAMIAVGSNGLRRRHLRAPATLEPNCLLTKEPVEFWTGPRSPFYFRHYWNGLPLFLHAHGYDVRPVSFPWRNPERRRGLAEARLLGARGRRHVVVDEACADEFADLFELLPPASVTILRRREAAESRADRFAFDLHRWTLRLTGWKGPLAEAGALGLGPRGGEDVKRDLLNGLRRRAERDWADPDFPLESPPLP